MQQKTSIVAILHSPSCLKRLAYKSNKLLQKSGIDFLEARLDSLPQTLLPNKWPLPVIATARHPAEGGKNNLSLNRRRQLLEQALPWSSGIDVEVRSAKQLSSTIARAHEEGKFVIGSFHDFKTVPPLLRLQELALRAHDSGADILKIAVTVNDCSDLLRLVTFQQSEKIVPVATMGMGKEGLVSRLVLPSFGSVLSYGWFAKPQVRGQCSANQLVCLISKLGINT